MNDVAMAVFSSPRMERQLLNFIIIITLGRPDLIHRNVEIIQKYTYWHYEQILATAKKHGPLGVI